MSIKIKAYRKLAGLTQTELAEQLGLKASAICKWEAGRVPAERVIDVERVTGIPRHELRPDVYPPEGEAA